MPENVVIGGEPAAGHADEMKSLDSQVVHQGVQIIRNGAGLRPGPGIRPAPAPSPPIEGDNSISRLDEARNVVLPAVGIACVGVEQYERHTAAAAVGVPEAHAREILVSATEANRTGLKRFKPLPQKTDWPVPRTLGKPYRKRSRYVNLKPTQIE